MGGLNSPFEPLNQKYMARSKRYKSLVEKIDKGKVYPVQEALAVLKESPVKFDAAVEVHMHLGIDPKKGEQMVRGTVVLPHGSGKTRKIAAFVSPEKEAEAKAAGADIIGTADVIEKIKSTGKIDFDIAVATPDMMKKLASIAKNLGQAGVMPNPKTETVSPNVTKMITELKGGKVAYKNDDTANVHQIVGRLSFPVEHLAENVKTFVDVVKKAKPTDSKGTYVRSITLTTTMGPGISISV